MQNQQPSEIKRQDGSLEIRWEDNRTSLLSAKILRENCPCASCRQERGELNHDKPISVGKKNMLSIVDASIDQQITIKQISPVGNYAITITWADGHSTGIYNFDHLRELAKK